MTLKEQKYISDLSLWMVVLSNIVSILMAIIQQWDTAQILWVYWSQSVIIGIINVYRIATLKEFSSKGMKMNGRAVPETKAARNQVAVFFAFHYGIFHFVYAGFMWQETPLSDFSIYEITFLLLVILGFFGSHGFSYKYNVNKDFKHKKPNLGTIMFYPYLRIIPMHLVIILGTTIGAHTAIIIFMLLKTLADAGTHMIEHHLFRKQ